MSRATTVSSVSTSPKHLVGAADVEQTIALTRDDPRLGMEIWGCSPHAIAKASRGRASVLWDACRRPGASANERSRLRGSSAMTKPSAGRAPSRPRTRWWRATRHQGFFPHALDHPPSRRDRRRPDGAAQGGRQGTPRSPTTSSSPLPRGSDPAPYVAAGARGGWSSSLPRRLAFGWVDVGDRAGPLLRLVDAAVTGQ
jgi:hypothetical protein